MADTQKTPSGHETLYTGQQFLDALTHHEIATLLEMLLGTLSPDMVANVLDQLPPDTRQTVQTILGLPDPSDPTQEQQAPSVSLAKLEQTWAALWQAWDHIVAEAAQEDGNYIVRERPWEAPYFDSTTFVRDLERVAQQMQPMLRTAFENEFIPATSFIDALRAPPDDDWFEDNGDPERGEFIRARIQDDPSAKSSMIDWASDFAPEVRQPEAQRHAPRQPSRAAEAHRAAGLARR